MFLCISGESVDKSKVPLLPEGYLHIICNGRAGYCPLSYFRTGRLALQPASGELIEVERILAAARAALAISSFCAVQLSSAAAFQYYGLVQFLLLLYSGHAIALLVLLYARREASSRFIHAVHASDVLWPAVICLFTNGLASPFFLFFIFASLAAAFRWGMREALLTMVAALVRDSGHGDRVGPLSAGRKVRAGGDPGDAASAHRVPGHICFAHWVSGGIGETPPGRSFQHFPGFRQG